jgi:hypothetical protein
MNDKIDLNLNIIVGKGGTGKSLFTELLYDSMQISGQSEIIGFSSNPYASPCIPDASFMTPDRFPYCVDKISAKEVIWEITTTDINAFDKQDQVCGLFNTDWGMISLGLQIRFWLMISDDVGSLYVAAKVINLFARRANLTLVLNDTTGNETIFLSSRDALIDLFNDKGWDHFLEPAFLCEQDQLHRFTKEEALQFLQTVPVVSVPYLPLSLRKLTNYSPDRPTLRSISVDASVSSLEQRLAERFLQKANTQIISAF